MMQKKDDEKGRRKLTLEEALEATRSIFGTKKPQDRLDEEVKVEGEAKQEKLPPGALLKIGATLFGASDPEIVAKRRKELQILDSLEYPGGKGMH